MDHTAFNLQRILCQPLPRKRSPDSDSTTHLSTREDERLSWPGWLTYSGQLTHISGHPSATGRAQDGERTLEETDVLPLSHADQPGSSTGYREASFQVTKASNRVHRKSTDFCELWPVRHRFKTCIITGRCLDTGSSHSNTNCQLLHQTERTNFWQILTKFYVPLYFTPPCKHVNIIRR